VLYLHFPLHNSLQPCPASASPLPTPCKFMASCLLWAFTNFQVSSLRFKPVHMSGDSIRVRKMPGRSCDKPGKDMWNLLFSWCVLLKVKYSFPYLEKHTFCPASSSHRSRAVAHMSSALLGSPCTQGVSHLYSFSGPVPPTPPHPASSLPVCALMRSPILFPTMPMSFIKSPFSFHVCPSLLWDSWWEPQREIVESGNNLKNMAALWELCCLQMALESLCHCFSQDAFCGPHNCLTSSACSGSAPNPWGYVYSLGTTVGVGRQHSRAPSVRSVLPMHLERNWWSSFPLITLGVLKEAVCSNSFPLLCISCQNYLSLV
jgi:hypothetical protein